MEKLTANRRMVLIANSSTLSKPMIAFEVDEWKDVRFWVYEIEC